MTRLNKIARWFRAEPTPSKFDPRTIENVTAADPPNPAIAAESKVVQETFIQKVLQLERKNNRVLQAMADSALADVNGRMGRMR